MNSFAKLGEWPTISLVKSMLFSLLMMMAAVAAIYATPKAQIGAPAPNLEDIVPHTFGTWVQKPETNSQVSLSVDGERSTDQPYDQTILRTYVNANGDEVMLALAYAHEQKQDIKIHRPEVCYVAQGYTLLSKSEAKFFLSPTIPQAIGKRLVTRRDGRLETVSYWVRIGDAYPQGGIDARMVIFRDGLKGKVDDGILVRASMVVADASDVDIAFDKQERFLADLVRSLALSAPDVLVPHLSIR